MCNCTIDSKKLITNVAYYASLLDHYFISNAENLSIIFKDYWNIVKAIPDDIILNIETFNIENNGSSAVSIGRSIALLEHVIYKMELSPMPQITILMGHIKELLDIVD
jgi:hypothetical protein